MARTVHTGKLAKPFARVSLGGTLRSRWIRFERKRRVWKGIYNLRIVPLFAPLDRTKIHFLSSSSPLHLIVRLVLKSLQEVNQAPYSAIQAAWPTAAAT